MQLEILILPLMHRSHLHSTLLLLIRDLDDELADRAARSDINLRLRHPFSGERIHLVHSKLERAGPDKLVQPAGVLFKLFASSDDAVQSGPSELERLGRQAERRERVGRALLVSIPLSLQEALRLEI